MFQHITDEDIKQIAEAYDNALQFDGRAIEGWLILGKAALQWRLRIEAQGYEIVETDNPEPYASAREMFADISLNNRMVVTRANCDHPLWNTETNVAFRVWHDMCHYNTLGDFELGGELAACSRQAEELLQVFNRPAALCALYTECIGQLAYRLDRGEFGPQKVAYLTNYS